MIAITHIHKRERNLHTHMPAELFTLGWDRRYELIAGGGETQKPSSDPHQVCSLIRGAGMGKEGGTLLSRLDIFGSTISNENQKKFPPSPRTRIADDVGLGWMGIISDKPTALCSESGAYPLLLLLYVVVVVLVHCTF